MRIPHIYIPRHYNNSHLNTTSQIQRYRIKHCDLYQLATLDLLQASHNLSLHMKSLGYWLIGNWCLNINTVISINSLCSLRFKLNLTYPTIIISLGYWLIRNCCLLTNSRLLHLGVEVRDDSDIFTDLWCVISIRSKTNFIGSNFTQTWQSGWVVT